MEKRERNDVTIKKPPWLGGGFCSSMLVYYSSNLNGNPPPTELAEELILCVFERFRPWSEAPLFSINTLSILVWPWVIVTLGEKVTVVEVSVDTVCMVAMVTPSSSIRPLVNDQIFWKVSDLSEILLSAAVNLNEPI